MRSNRIPVAVFALLILALTFGCGGGGGGGNEPAARTLVALALQPLNPTLPGGGVQQFTAIGTYSDGGAQDLTASASWASSNPAVAAISNAAGANGRATAIGAGTTTITATMAGVSSSTTLTVITATLLSIAVSPTNPSIALGLTQQFTATGTYSDGSTQTLTASANWISSAPAVASISSGTVTGSGRAASLTTGTTTITAAVGGVSASTTLTVTPPALLSLALRPANRTIALGASQQVTATGAYTDGSTQNLTETANWTSSDTAVATISNAAGTKGRATSVGNGTATIAAALGSLSASTTLRVTSGPPANVIPITVNGALCSANSYPNKPCVSVTVCTPGTSTCKTIDDILLDTGSYGLRIFKDALNVTLPQVTGAFGAIAECVQFGDGSSMWGPVQTASVILANEPPVQVSIQVVDSTFGTRSSACSNADPSPAVAGFNGILGVGLFKEDCGATCVTSVIGRYFACAGDNCNGTTVPLTDQVRNPAAFLPRDNNGVIVQLPAVPLGGTTAVNGSLILGVDTQANNVPDGLTVYSASATGNFTTQFGGRTYARSFIDSGSNGFFFTPPSGTQLPICFPPYTGWFCPTSTLGFTATNAAASGAPSGAVPFSIGNYVNLIASPSLRVFSEAGGTFSTSAFDWGLPFFFGRSVIVGYDSAQSSIGTGPYWAY